MKKHLRWRKRDMREIRQGIQASEQKCFNVPVLGNKYVLRHLSAWKYAYYHSTSSRVGVGNKCAVYHLSSQREALPAYHTVTKICWSCGCGIMHNVWNWKFGVGTAGCRSVVSRVWRSKSGTPVLTERLVTEGNWYEARAGHLIIDSHESNHNSWREE